MLSSHPNELAEIVGESSSSGKPKLAQAKLEKFSSVSVKPLPSGSKRAQAMTRAIAELVARDLRRIAIVEGNGFWRMMAILEPQYRVPSRKHVTKILHDIYAEIKSVVLPENATRFKFGQSLHSTALLSTGMPFSSTRKPKKCLHRGLFAPFGAATCGDS